MTYRPKIFPILALFSLLIAVSFPIQIMFSYGYRPWEIHAVFAGLAPLNLLVIAFAIIQAVLLLRGSPWLLFSTPWILFLIFWNNWVVAVTELNSSLMMTLVANGIVVVIHLPLMRSQTLDILLHPQLRWWQSAPRKIAVLKAVLQPLQGEIEMHSSTFDISKSGAFIQLGQTHWKDETDCLPDMELGTFCKIRLQVNGSQAIQGKARVVRYASPKGRYPSGLALEFTRMSRQNKFILQGLIQGLTQEG